MLNLDSRGVILPTSDGSNYSIITVNCSDSTAPPNWCGQIFAQCEPRVERKQSAQLQEVQQAVYLYI